nr:hypothetical protein [Paraburkholderia sp. ZP32-5]
MNFLLRRTGIDLGKVLAYRCVDAALQQIQLHVQFFERETLPPAFPGVGARILRGMDCKAWRSGIRQHRAQLVKKQRQLVDQADYRFIAIRVNLHLLPHRPEPPARQQSTVLPKISSYAKVIVLHITHRAPARIMRSRLGWKRQ